MQNTGSIPPLCFSQAGISARESARFLPRRLISLRPSISTYVRIYKYTESYRLTIFLKHPVKTPFEPRARRGGLGGRKGGWLFSEAKPQAGNKPNSGGREEPGRCLRAQPGAHRLPRCGGHSSGHHPERAPPPRPDPLPGSLSSLPPHPLLLHHFLSPLSSPAPFPLTSDPFPPPPPPRPQPAPPRPLLSPPPPTSTPAASPRRSHPPGLSAAPCWPRCSRFPWSGAPSPQGSRSGGRPYCLLRPLLQPRHRRDAQPPLIRPRRTSALRSPLPHHPLLAPAPASPSPRAEARSRQQPPAPTMALPPSSARLSQLRLCTPVLPPPPCSQGLQLPPCLAPERSRPPAAPAALCLLGYVVH